MQGGVNGYRVDGLSADERGVIPRSFEVIFKELQKMKEAQGWEYTLTVTMVEVSYSCTTRNTVMVQIMLEFCLSYNIHSPPYHYFIVSITQVYNENIYDLLSHDEMTGGRDGNGNPRVDIRVTASGEDVELVNVTRIEVNGLGQLLDALDYASEKRKKGCTDINVR